MLSLCKGGSCKEYTKSYVVYDLETTGLSYSYDKIIEISAVKVVDGVIVDQFNELVNPFCPIPYAASSVNNITDDMVCNCCGIEEILPAFLEFIGDDILVGHNIASFDNNFLHEACNRLYGKNLGNDYIDTLRMARMALPQLTHHNLSSLAQYYGISSEGAHRALVDCLMNQKIYENLLIDLKDGFQVLTCPKCGGPLMKRKGKYGAFFGCSNYPNCHYTRNI